MSKPKSSGQPKIRTATAKRYGPNAGVWEQGRAWLALGVTGLLIGVMAWSARVDATPKQVAAPSQPGTSTASTNGQAKETWHTSYAAARAEAARQDKPVLLRFTAAWCPPCQVMDANVWPNDEVKAAVAKQVVPAKIDVDDEANVNVARRYGIRTIPTLLLVDANGDELARGGFMNAKALIEFLQKQ